MKDFLRLRKYWGKTIVLCLYIVLVYLIPVVTSLPQIQHYEATKQASLVPQDTDSFFRQYIALMRTGAVQRAYSLLSDQAQAMSSSSEFTILSQDLASTTGQPTFVGYSLNYDEGFNGLGTVRDGVYELTNNDPRYPYDKYMLVEVTTVDTSSTPRVIGFHLQANANSANNLPLFDFNQLPELFLALAIPLFVLYTATRYLLHATKPKWWIFLTIVLGSLTLRSSNGSYGLTVHIGGFLTQNTGLAAATITYVILIPIGALIYYVYRKKVEAGSTQPTK